MSLTREEEAELRMLEAEEAERKQRQTGAQAVARVQSFRRPAAPKTRPFSLYRATVGSLKDAAQGVIDTVDDLGDYLGRKTGIGGIAFGSQAKNGIAEYQGYEEFNQRGGDSVFGTKETGPKLPALKGEEDAGTAEKVVRGIGSFMVPFAGAAKAVGIARGASWAGRAGRAMLAGAAVDFAQVDPVSGNMANVIRDTFGIDNKTLDALASEEDDEALYARFKAAVVNAPIGLAADAVLEAGFKSLKAYRAWKGTADEAKEAIDEIKRDRAITPLSEKQVHPSDKPDGAAKATAEETSFWEIPKEYDPSKHAEARPQPTSFEDVVDYLKRAAGTEVDPEALSRLADNLLWGNPENALAKLGVDPAKLDFSMFDDPDLLGRLHKGLGEVYETIASKLGRSNIRVTERATIQAARVFASTADVLKDVHGSTENLAEYLTGARMFVGAHAHKLLAQADEAAAEILAGGAGPKWTAFLESFHRHAYYLGTVRGAGSEVGRALRSLQMIAKVGKPEAARKVGDVLEAERVTKPGSVQKGASDYADRLETDADKLEALTKLKALGGDIGELSRSVRQQNGSILRRLDAGLKETIGNLFSTSTAVYNLAAGGAMLGTRALSKALAGVGRMALSPLGGKHSMAARVALTDAWAYTDGILSGFREATRNTLAVLDREGMSELALNLDGLGLRKLAVTAAKKSSDADVTLARGNFERTDVKTFREFSVSQYDQRALREKIEALPGPAFFTEGLKALVRVGSSVINAAGSLSRSGTILFINMPDQFVGTLAARAGAYSQGVRIAASEAAELGLEGKELSSFLKARTVQLMGDTKGWHEDPFEAGKREAMAAHGDTEAREVLFQDDLELGINKAIVNGVGSAPLIHMVVPFIKTPLRILERTAIDFTPLGLIKDRIRNAIIAGGPEGDEAMARMSLGLIAVMTAYQLAEDRTIVGSDGSYKSSARLSRGSYTLKLGDDNIEFSRVDPLGTLLGFGADIHAYYQTVSDDPEAPGIIAQATEAFALAVMTNILSKTWLTSLQNIVDLAGITDPNDFSSRLKKFGNSMATRFVPASGTQRQIEKAGEDHLKEAFSFTESLMKSSVGSDSLPLKRDYLIGRPLPIEGWDRVIGIRAAPGAGDDDPLLVELEKLSFDLPVATRSIEGVKLNATQFSRWLELKGQVVKNPRSGLNLEQTLTALIALPEYKAMSRQAKVQAMRDEMKGFSRLATDQLLREDKGFAYRSLRKEVYDQTLLKGGNRDQADAETKRLGEQLGLTPAN